MAQLFPTLLIGGYPNRGKSVLGHILSKLLRRRHSPHYLLRATPDGEGNWFQEAPLHVANRLREVHRRPWHAGFEEALEGILVRRPLPFLVDAGGRPTEAQQRRLFSLCSHALLLGADEKEVAAWGRVAERFHLEPVAHVLSTLDGEDMVLGRGEPLCLRLSRLERQRGWEDAISEAWALLAAAVAAALEWDAGALWRYHSRHAPPSVLPVNVERWWEARAGRGAPWPPSLLPSFLEEVPLDAPLALFGARPVWLGAAVGAASRAPLFLFDGSYGWLAIPSLLENAGEGCAWEVTVGEQAGATALSFRLASYHLPPRASLSGPLPLPARPGLVVFDGRLPVWLYAALARHYNTAGYDVAVAVPRKEHAVRVNGPRAGEALPWRVPDIP